MSLSEQIQKDLVAAMKSREEHRLSTLRMVKSALKNREIVNGSVVAPKSAAALLSELDRYSSRK